MSSEQKIDKITELFTLLCEVYEAWNQREGLDLGSADEHLTDESLTGKQREWLSAFCVLWERTEGSV